MREFSKIFIRLLLIIIILKFIGLFFMEYSQIQKGNTLDNYFKTLRIDLNASFSEPIVSQGVERVYNVEASAYAPHDLNAVEGMCHDGDPSTTFSGTYPTPGRTLAVDRDIIPMGSEVEIMGLDGGYIAEDIGGAIKGYRIDICMETQQEALDWGRQEVTILVREKE